MNVLQVSNLQVCFTANGKRANVLKGVTFSLERAKILSMVGASGAGKTVVARCILGMLETPGGITGGSVLLDGIDLFYLPLKEMRNIRGRKLFMIFQNVDSSLNPAIRVHTQVAEAMVVRQRLSWKKARHKAFGLLEKVGLPACRMNAYPHALSGGMRQRVLIAMALGLKPTVLIADEPTTNIDPRSRNAILDLLWRLKTEEGMAILHITHDLREVCRLADKVAVLYGGRIVETKPLASFLEKPQHPFSRRLLESARYLDPNLLPPGRFR